LVWIPLKEGPKVTLERDLLLRRQANRLLEQHEFAEVEVVGIEEDKWGKPECGD
jgi:hypothetical protein